MNVRGAAEAVFRAIEREQPVLAERLVTRLAHVSIAVELPEEAFTIHAARGVLETCVGLDARAEIRAETTEDVLARILDGSLELDSALLVEAVRLFGEPEMLARMDDALSLFVSAGVRAPSVALVWERFVATAQTEMGRS